MWVTIGVTYYTDNTSPDSTAIGDGMAMGTGDAETMNPTPATVNDAGTDSTAAAAPENTPPPPSPADVGTGTASENGIGIGTTIDDGMGIVTGTASDNGMGIGTGTGSNDGYRVAEVSDLLNHASLSTGCWIALNGDVYSLSNFVHPGGANHITENCGADHTKDWSSVPEHQKPTIRII